MPSALKYLLFILLFIPRPGFSQDEDRMLTDSLDLEAADTSYDENKDPETYVQPPVKPLALHEVKEEEWRKATDGLDYSKDTPNPPKERKKRDTESSPNSFDWTGMTKGFGSFMQVLAVLFALCVVAYGIYWMMQTPRNKVIARDGTEITLANLDEYIHETDLERYLREALSTANWPLAVRLYFLQAIKQLSEKNAINWSKEKTNRDYQREMRDHPLGAQFRSATRQYERVWYGNQPLSAQAFAEIEPEFKKLLEEI